MQHPAFNSIVEGKLQGLLGRTSGYIESLPLAVRHRIDGLQGVQAEQTKIEAEFQAEILELEKKYAKRYAPLYAQRARIVAGSEEPSAELVELGKKQDEEDEDSDDEDEPAEPKEPRPAPSKADIESAPKVCLYLFFSASFNSPVDVLGCS